MSNASLADQMLAQLHIQQTVPAAEPATQLKAVPVAGEKADVLVRLPLVQLRIDHHQPRNYLPADLRAGLVHHGDARSTLQMLITRAAENDAIAAGTLEGIRALARSIADVGLQQPIRISADNDKTYRIVDGERRFWAVLFLRETTNDARYDSISAIVHAPEASADELPRAQWASNLCREDIPAIDFAETIAQIREQFLAHVARDRERYVALLGDEGEGLTTPELALMLTQRELARLTGRSLSERHLYTFLSIAERLKPPAKALARAYNIGLRPLKGIVRLPEQEQVRLLRKMAGIVDAATGNHHTTATRPGRPTSLQRSINACIGLKDTLNKLTEQNLMRQSPADVQTLLDELDAAATHIEQARELVQTCLPAPSSSAIGSSTGTTPKNFPAVSTDHPVS